MESKIFLAEDIDAAVVAVKCFRKYIQMAVNVGEKVISGLLEHLSQNAQNETHWRVSVLVRPRL